MCNVNGLPSENKEFIIIIIILQKMTCGVRRINERLFRQACMLTTVVKMAFEHNVAKKEKMQVPSISTVFP